MSIATFLGSRVHDCLEILYDRVQKGALPAPEDLQIRFDAAWKEQWSEANVIRGKDMTGEDYRRLSLRCVEKYYAGG